MPNSKAKQRKRNKALLNKKWSVEGRTAKQHKKWLLNKKKRDFSYLFGVENSD